MFLYVHGLNSSAASFKARVLRERLDALGRGAEFLCPALHHSPAMAMEALEAIVAGLDPATLTLVGSSLGGHYSAWLAERHGLRAAMLNPAVRPHRQLSDFLGPQKNLYTGEAWELTPAHLDELARFHVAAITKPERYFLLVTTGDEVLDYREALAKYRGCEQIVVQGSDHGMDVFAEYADRVIEFGDGA